MRKLPVAAVTLDAQTEVRVIDSVLLVIAAHVLDQRKEDGSADNEFCSVIR